MAKSVSTITSIGEILFDVYPSYKRLGGAPFNFIYHVWKLTGRGNFISRIGSDDNGKAVMKYLEQTGINTKYIQTDNTHPTGTVQVALAEDKSPSFTIAEDQAYDFIEFTEETDNLISNKTALLYFGTLAQRNEISRDSIQAEWGKNIKYFCDLNLRQNFYSEQIIRRSLTHCDILKANLDELKIINELILNKKFKIELCSKELMEKFNIGLVCITMGEGGSILFNRDSSHRYKNPVNGIVDTVGAGDAFAAILAIGYLRNWEIEKINQTASEFAGDICIIEGAIPDDDFIYMKYKGDFNYNG